MDSQKGWLSTKISSGNSAYNAFKSLLEKSEDPTTKTQALSSWPIFRITSTLIPIFLPSLNFPSTIKVFVSDYEERRRKKLTMMVIPALLYLRTEDWSFTFYEGLNRHPDSISKDRTVSGHGCGNGWISIALSDKWSPLKVCVLDINLRAIKVARVNLNLNALDENGQLIYHNENESLLDRV